MPTIESLYESITKMPRDELLNHIEIRRQSRSIIKPKKKKQKDLVREILTLISKMPGWWEKDYEGLFRSK